MKQKKQKHTSVKKWLPKKISTEKISIKEFLKLSSNKEKYEELLKKEKYFFGIEIEKDPNNDYLLFINVYFFGSPLLLMDLMKNLLADYLSLFLVSRKSMVLFSLATALYK